MGLNKLLQSGGVGPPDFEFSGRFGIVGQGFAFQPCLGSGSSMNVPCPRFPPTSNNINHGRIGPISAPTQPNFKIHNPQNDEKAPCTPRRSPRVDEKETPPRSPHEDDLKAPRRSLRGVKPNPKYLNMVEFDQLLTMLSSC